MSVVNFSIPKRLEERVEETIQEKGFASKAEFFRFAAVYFMDILDRKVKNEDERLEYLTSTLRNEISETYRDKKIVPLEEQLADV